MYVDSLIQIPLLYDRSVVDDIPVCRSCAW